MNLIGEDLTREAVATLQQVREAAKWGKRLSVAALLYLLYRWYSKGEGK